jgi:hypothetical protein
MFDASLIVFNNRAEARNGASERVSDKLAGIGDIPVRALNADQQLD